MKKWILIPVIALLLLAPFQRADVGKLRPVKLVMLDVRRGKAILETDTGDRGEGRTPDEALEKLKQSAPGALFLDTADFVLVTENARKLLPELEDTLRPAVEVCIVKGNPDLGEAAEYLSAHNTGVSLLEWRTGEKTLPVLREKGGRYALCG